MNLSDTARIPTRPLSIEYKEHAVPKELLIDYNEGKIYVTNSNGELIDITNLVAEEVIKELKEEGYIITGKVDANHTTIVLEDGSEIGLQPLLDRIKQGIKDAATKSYVDGRFDELKTEDIEETDDKQFISSNEKEHANAASITSHKSVTILSGEDNWELADGKYSQRIDIEDILESDIPIIDISLNDDINIAQREVEAWSCIFKINTYDGYIIVYSNNIIANDINIKMMLNR